MGLIEFFKELYSVKLQIEAKSDGLNKFQQSHVVDILANSV